MDADQIELECRVLAQKLVSAAGRLSVTVSTAESCTAGMVASFIADVPGASEVLRGGAVTYCDEIKHRVLGVSMDVLASYTAVSGPTALAMARGSRELFGADISVSVTGYAGPGGGSESDPVGTVYLGIGWGAKDQYVRCAFEGNRRLVRLQAAREALDLLYRATLVFEKIAD